MNHAVVAHLRIPDHSNFGSFCRVGELIDNDHGYRTIDAQRQALAPSRIWQMTGNIMVNLGRPPPVRGWIQAGPILCPFGTFSTRRSRCGGLSMTSEGGGHPAERHKAPNFPPSSRTSPVSLSERMTLKRIARSVRRAAAAILRSTARCRRRDFSEWRPPPSERRHSGCGRRLSRQSLSAFPSGSSVTSL